MKRLRLVIAGNDRQYVKSLVHYIFSGYSEYFELHSFTKQAFLSEFLGKSDERADVVLAERDYLCSFQPAQTPPLYILLSDEKSSTDIDGMKCIYKYQHADKIVSQLIAAYSAGSGREFLSSGQKAARIIAVFSAEGGCGKSSIAAASSIICSRQGGRVLYFNLESISSTNIFFSGDSGQTLSNVIYYLKENSGKIASKIEGAKCMDTETGVCHFKPPENQRDMEELLFEDVELFINTMKKAALYDYIFIDLSSGFMPRNLAILKNCDTLMRVRTAGRTGNTREELEIKEFEKLSYKYGIDIEGKCLDIKNRDRQIKVTDSANSIGYYPEMENRKESGKAYSAEFLKDTGKILKSNNIFA